MSEKIMKTNNKKYKIKLKKINKDSPMKITIVDQTYFSIENVTYNSDFTNAAKNKVKEIIEKHNFYPGSTIDVNKAISLIKEGLEQNGIELCVKPSKKETILDNKIKEIFYEPFPFVSYQNYISNLIQISNHKSNESDWDKNVEKIDKHMITYRKYIKKWDKLIPQIEIKLAKLLSGNFDQEKIAIWQGFFRDNAFSPLVSSFLEIINHPLIDQQNTVDAEWVILNMDKAFKAEKKVVKKFIPLLEDEDYEFPSLNNNYSHALFGGVGVNSFLQYIFLLKEKGEKKFDNFSKIISIMNKHGKTNIIILESVASKFIWSEKNFIAKLGYYGIIFCKDKFKQIIKCIRLGTFFDLGQEIIDFAYANVLSEKLADMELHNISSLIKIYLKLIKDIHIFVKENFDTIKKSTWKFLAMFFKEHSYLDSLYGATFINLQKTNWTKVDKMRYFDIAFKNECKFYEKILSLDDIQLKRWVLFAKYEE